VGERGWRHLKNECYDKIDRYEGWVVMRTLYVRERILWSMRCLILSQYKDLRAGLIWEDFGAWRVQRAMSISRVIVTLATRKWQISQRCDVIIYKKVCCREEHSACVLLSWCTVWHFSGENLLMANQPLLRNWSRKLPNSAK